MGRASQASMGPKKSVSNAILKKPAGKKTPKQKAVVTSLPTADAATFTRQPFSLEVLVDNAKDCLGYKLNDSRPLKIATCCSGFPAQRSDSSLSCTHTHSLTLSLSLSLSLSGKPLSLSVSLSLLYY